MDIALLNTRITIQKATVTADAIGNRKNGWVDYHSCAATVSGEAASSAGRETNAVGTTVDHSDIAFTVRWCNAVSQVESVGYRILFNGGIYNIVSVDHMSFKKKSMKFRCKKEVRS
jgi:SPP1 family predicted phage head-tail adaptor